LTYIERKYLYLAAIACSTALIFVAIFPWRGFDPSGHWHRVSWIPFVSRPVRVIDVVANLLLFAPLGASIALHAQRAALARTTSAAFVCSFVGEWAQVYSRFRYPSAGDLVCNVVGAEVAAYGTDRLRRGGRGGTMSGPRASDVRRPELAVTYRGGPVIPPGTADSALPTLNNDRGRARVD
jgi:glycopeptide antibiotics resistance protein